ncbi:uncharacterized protein BDV17DRAFT_287359 [Aspergillus undulatus]|uniref:uncharacterized protein n=1 Tax=Aspergillus undulatus TaxID=1810928 RepID=UPI003CCD4563
MQKPPLKLDDIWPIIYLESLQSVHLHDLDPDGVALLFQNKNQGHECHIEHLGNVTKETSACKLEDVTALIPLPKTLKSLSSCWDHDATKQNIDGKKRTEWKITNHEVWTAIQKYRNTLESLDIFETMPRKPRAHRKADHFGLLTDFTQLSPVSPEEHPTFQLGNPHSLHWDFEKKKTVPDYATQLNELVSEAERSGLKSLQVSDASIVNAHKPPSVLPPEYQALEDGSSSQSPIQFNMKEVCTCRRSPTRNCPFPAAGQCLIPWRKTHYLHMDGIERYWAAQKRAQRKVLGLQRDTLSSSDVSNRLGIFPYTHLCPLPPLVQIAVCFAPSNAPPEHLDIEEDLRALHDKIWANQDEEIHFLIDVYFLPSARLTDCTAHYRAEKALRSNSLAMNREARSRLDAISRLPHPERPAPAPAPAPILVAWIP